jgi:hypothetical protein
MNVQRVRRVGLNHRLADERGFLLIGALVLLAALSLLGTTAYVMTSTDIQIGGNYRNTRKVLQAAIAGTERGREVLRASNASDTYPFTDPMTLNAELAYHAGVNATFSLYASGSDDIPLIGPTPLPGSDISYTVYLSNDSFDILNGTPISDSNGRVLITSVATDSKGSRAVVELAVSLPPPEAGPDPVAIPPPLAMVGLPGNDATFIGGNSNAKTLNGDDQCGTAPSLPVVAPVAPGSLSNIQEAISNSKPKTYHTKLPNGTHVDASTPTGMNEIAKLVTSTQIDSVKQNYGVDLQNAASLNSLINSIGNYVAAKPGIGSVVPGGSSSGSVNLGNINDLKAVVVNGDFTMHGNASGAGLLVVTGQLTFAGNINYTGLIMVVGKGTMIRNGGGHGTISGAIWVANTAGPDGIVGNVDDSLGMSVLDTSGGGASNLQYCSSAVNNATALVSDDIPPDPSFAPLLVRAFRQVH